MYPHRNLSNDGNHLVTYDSITKQYTAKYKEKTSRKFDSLDAAEEWVYHNIEVDKDSEG